MKHINESIIGRRNAGTQTISDMGLRQDIRKFISENNLNQMVSNFRLIFKNGKWL